MTRSPRAAALLVAALLAAPLLGPLPPALAQEAGPVLTIKDHRFEPAELRVPAGKAVTITVRNLDATAEEFESKALKIEKVIAGNATGTVRLRPLEPGRYPFVGEYHEDSAKGVIVAE